MFKTLRNDDWESPLLPRNRLPILVPYQISNSRPSMAAADLASKQD